MQAGVLREMLILLNGRDRLAYNACLEYVPNQTKNHDLIVLNKLNPPVSQSAEHLASSPKSLNKQSLQ